MTNSLLSTRWVERLIDDVIRAECAGFEAAVKEFTDQGYTIDELMIERNWKGVFKVRVITPEERWLNWHSDNHGFGRQYRSTHEP